MNPVLFNWFGLHTRLVFLLSFDSSCDGFVLITVRHSSAMTSAEAAAVADAVDQLSLEYNPSNRTTFYAKRVELFEKYFEREQQRIEEARKAAVPIKVVLPDGAIKPAIKGATTPLDIAAEISKSLAKKVLVAKVDGELFDAFRPLEGDCALQLFSWDDAEGKEVSAITPNPPAFAFGQWAHCCRINLHPHAAQVHVLAACTLACAVHAW